MVGGEILDEGGLEKVIESRVRGQFTRSGEAVMMNLNLNAPPPPPPPPPHHPPLNPSYRPMRSTSPRPLSFPQPPPPHNFLMRDVRNNKPSPPPPPPPPARTSFRVNVPVRIRSALFGGGRENGRALARRIRWVSRQDATLFAHVQKQVLAHFWEMCRANSFNPSFTLKRIETADAIIVSEDVVPAVDPSTGKILQAQPMMPPTTSVRITGFIALRLKSVPSVTIDVICTTPGRSQGKALLKFVIQKARELGFSSVRFGSTHETLPIMLAPPPSTTYRRPSPSRMSEDPEDDDEEDSSESSDGEEDEEEEEEKERRDPTAVSKMQIDEAKSAGVATSRPPMLMNRRLRVMNQVDLAYRHLMRYLDTQSIFKPKIGGHLLQFSALDES